VNFARWARSLAVAVAYGGLFLMPGGCGDGVVLPTAEQLAEFRNAGPIQPEIDVGRLLASRRNHTGQYTLIAGDLLEVQLPAVLQDGAAPQGAVSTASPYLVHRCRVREDGTILVPVIGAVEAAGRTVAQVEGQIIAAFYPKYTTLPPSIVVTVAEPRAFKVTITGAVEAPGVYALPHDQMSLVSLIMAAGGIAEDGAGVIFIHDGDGQSRVPVKPTVEADPTASKSGGPLPVPVQLAFRQSGGRHEGMLFVRDETGLLYSERLDVTDPSQREGFIARLHQTFPGISRDFVTLRLNELADLLKPGSADKALMAEIRRRDTEGPDDAPDARAEPAVAGRWESGGGVKPLILPVKGTNIPFTDVALSEGARVEVEPLAPETFTVVGLVNKPGAFPYPPNTRYNLMQALAFAGGVDPIADPRYVRVYRQGPDGELVDASFPLQGKSLVGAPAITLKPGDIVAVEQTARTHLNLLLSQILSVRAAVGATYIHYTGQDLRRYD